MNRFCLVVFSGSVLAACGAVDIMLGVPRSSQQTVSGNKAGSSTSGEQVAEVNDSREPDIARRQVANKPEINATQ